MTEPPSGPSSQAKKASTMTIREQFHAFINSRRDANEHRRYTLDAIAAFAKDEELQDLLNEVDRMIDVWIAVRSMRVQELMDEYLDLQRSEMKELRGKVAGLKVRVEEENNVEKELRKKTENVEEQGRKLLEQIMAQQGILEAKGKGVE